MIDPGEPAEFEEIDCKIVLVGDSKCGKTALVQRFISDTFVENAHSARLDEFNDLMNKRGRKRQNTDTINDGKASKKQLCMQQSLFGVPKPRATEEQQQLATLRFVVGTGQPFSVVEHPDFVNLMKVTAGRAPRNRKILMQNLTSAYETMINDLKDKLTDISAVCVTADCWTVFKRSYLGMTIHWLDPKTLDRVSQGLACRRIFGSHTYETLANVIEPILEDYRIDNKTTMMVTDSGSNFVKAFRMFGIDCESMLEEEENENDETELPSVEEITDALHSQENYGRLPPHHRCIAHSLNLLGTKDVEEAEKNNATYKRVSRQVFAKCQALFNRQNQSSKASDKVKDTIGRYLLVPGATRWNSFYDALTLVLEKRNKVDQLCRELEVPIFKNQDFEFLEEYCMVMKPVAKALDILQGDSGMYLGYILPTLTIVKKTLDEMTNLVHCEALKVALLNGFEKRFSEFFNREEYRISAALVPKFKLHWLEDAQNEKLKKDLECVVGRKLKLEAAEVPVNDTTDDKDDFFSILTMKKKASNSGAQQEVSNYLQDSVTELQQCSDIIKKLFIRYNTAVPSSAHCERLFSAGGLIFSERRGRLSDKNFEMQLLLRFNKFFHQENVKND